MSNRRVAGWFVLVGFAIVAGCASTSGQNAAVAVPKETPPEPGAFRSVLLCGNERVTVGYSKTAMLLTIGGETFEMRQAVSASGAKYESVNDPTTTLWNKGDRTTITVRGRTLPECTLGTQAGATYRAHGNEPFWSLEIADSSLTLKTVDGSPMTVTTRGPEFVDGGRRYASTSGGQSFTATVLDRPCADNMSGMQYPNTVTVLAGGKEYRGCGGDPASLLHGAEWLVEDIDRAGIVDNLRVTLRFGTDSRVAGNASCNSYSGSYTLTGEGLTVSKIVTTLKACAPALMTQEAKFLDVLANVRRFEVRPDGALVLSTSDGRTITARR
jgi:heat shock protein HslJ/membrane-bound inhibitor of C-type lysozyme